MSLEKDFCRSIINCTKGIPCLSLDRIESSCTPGFPDIVACLEGIYGLLEIKVAKSNKLILTQAQMPWHKLHEEVKGNHWLLYKNDDVYGVFKIKDVKQEAIKHTSEGCSIKLDGQYLLYDNHLIVTKNSDTPLREVYKRIIEFVCKKRR
jgi:Holliday junction resolvase